MEQYKVRGGGEEKKEEKKKKKKNHPTSDPERDGSVAGIKRESRKTTGTLVSR